MGGTIGVLLGGVSWGGVVPESRAGGGGGGWGEQAFGCRKLWSLRRLLLLLEPPLPPPISISLVAKLRGRRVSFLLYVCDALQKERWQSVSVGWSVSKVRSVCAAGLGGHSISMHQDGNSR